MAVCIKCGRYFEPKSPQQTYCYETCVPSFPRAEHYDASKIQQDCIMYHEEKGGYCSGLQELYCGYGGCKFYKRRKDNEQSNTGR